MSLMFRSGEKDMYWYNGTVTVMELSCSLHRYHCNNNTAIWQVCVWINTSYYYMQICTFHCMVYLPYYWLCDQCWHIIYMCYLNVSFLIVWCIFFFFYYYYMMQFMMMTSWLYVIIRLVNFSIILYKYNVNTFPQDGPTS
jgi:hypothetical protein